MTIARSKPLTRSAALKRGRWKRGRVAHPIKPRCVKPRCFVIAVAADMCKDHLIAEMDKLAKRYVHERDGMRCQDTAPHECGGGIDWAHTETRKSLGTRWLMEGAVDLCRKRHTYYTNRERKWVQWCERRLGRDLWERVTAYADSRAGVPWKAHDFLAIYEMLLHGPVTLAMLTDGRRST